MNERKQKVMDRLTDLVGERLAKKFDRTDVEAVEALLERIKPPKEPAPPVEIPAGCEFSAEEIELVKKGRGFLAARALECRKGVSREVARKVLDRWLAAHP